MDLVYYQDEKHNFYYNVCTCPIKQTDKRIPKESRESRRKVSFSTTKTYGSFQFLRILLSDMTVPI